MCDNGDTVTGRFSQLIPAKEYLLAVHDTGLAIIGWSTVEGRTRPRILADIDQDSPILSAACDPDHRFAILGDGKGRAQVWKISSRAPFSKSLKHKFPVTQVALSHDARLAASADAKGNLALWLLPQGVPLALPSALQGNRQAITKLSFGEDDSLWVATPTEVIHAQYSAPPSSPAEVVKIAERNTGRRLEGFTSRSLTPQEWGGL